MKKSILILTILMSSLTSVNGQMFPFSCVINFEDNPCSDGSFWELNLPGGSSNIWSIGIPHNTVFDSAFSGSNAIFTDGGYYPVNNRSSFFISYKRNPFCMCLPVIGGWYKFDSDSLRDYGMIEMSLDNGRTWQNALSDTVIPDYDWRTPKPVLTGRIHRWTEFEAFLPLNTNIDSIAYRFTFISDGIETNQEGWMLDDIKLLVHYEGNEDFGLPKDLNIFPNPASDQITLSSKTISGEMDVSVFDMMGQLAFQQKIRSNDYIDISGLGRGIYMARVSDGSRIWVKKVVKE